MRSLSENGNETSSYIFPLGTQSNRCSEQVNRTDRIFSFTRVNKHFELNEGRSLLQLVPRYECIRPERTELQLVRIQKPLLLPTVEPNLPSSAEGQERKSNNDSGNSIMEVNNLFSRPHGLVNLKTTPPTSNEDHIKFKNRMEDQRRLLKSQGLRNYAIDLLLSKE
ncbi:hypothetical protein AYI70_g5088 [Smittium culicis]|uniref:Uncharacterized protein n=1 Tax=Smittium culicis TaxID=133412 RepID=A0A1R1XW23_9FUNG|nr:hypothetical protein AYI70_g5088 [Smittium culicis]